MQFDHRSGETLAIDGANIYFEVKGEQQHETLLFLHGGFGTIEDFNPLLPDLERSYRVIGIDSRGQGKSTLGSSRLTYERLQTDAQRVLQHLEVDRVSLVGFSDGGITAYRLACANTIEVRKIVAIGAHWHPKEVDAVRELYLKVTGDSWRKKFPATFESYRKLNPEPDFDALARALVGMWLDPNTSGYPGDAVKNIACPLLIARGDDDHLTSRQGAVELSNLVKGAHLANIAFAGHVVFEDQKQPFMAALNQFLR